MTVGLVRRALAGVVAGAVTAVARGALDLQAPGGQERWTRTNHRGEPISLLEGPAAAAGLLAGGLVGAASARGAVALTVATASGAAFGLIDDLGEDTSSRRKGLRGHLGALARGELTTGGLKVLGIGGAALVAAAVATPLLRTDGTRRSTVGWLADVAASGALIASSANLVNLLDLRPGRALKAVTLVAGPLALGPGGGAGAGASVLGVVGAAMDQDLAEADMLGDGGANALGATLGTAVVLSAPRPVRLACLAAVVGLTVASEKVSFTRVIERTPVLRDIDGWGRRPVDPAADRSS
jgi:UDP-N-acetylmuramyl pentapeptide phosphotransferase/UDP-N-acetylglucosamine-1-phosphate transferase